jgi:hypothetical protein
MWLIKFLPDWIFYAILFAGILGLLATYLLKFIPIPSIALYRTPIQLASIVLIVIGTFMSGALWNEDAWKARVAELEKQVAEASVQSEKVTTKYVTKYVDRTKVIKEKGEQIVQLIDREVVKYDNTCKLPSEVVKLHNEAAKGPTK